MAGCLSGYNSPATSNKDAGTGSGTGGVGGQPDGGTGTTTPPTSTPPPAPPAPPPAAAKYVRGSLVVPYQLTPRAEYGRIVQNNVTMQDTDFQSNAVNVSASQKMDEIGALPELLGGPTNLIPNAEDRQRSNFIPFRGNPSDVKFLSVNNQASLFVPLGGDVMTPGNEVAVVQNNQVVTRVKVGVRPQRLAVHPAGLIFVCNQYSNYISIIDPTTNQLLVNGGQPVEIKTEYMCADLTFVPSNSPQDTDHQFLYVANRWRHSVLKYTANIVRDPLSNKPVNVIQNATPDPNVPNKPLAEITNVGNNPYRLAVSEQQDAVYVANNKGGEVARVLVNGDSVDSRITINAVSADIVNIQDLLFVPTLTADRGLLAADDAHPQLVITPPFTVTGVDGQQHQGHPGSMFDNTKSYNFEDLRNGLFQLDFKLSQNNPPTNQAGTSVYYTDDISSEPNFQTQQKVLQGAIPEAIVRNAAGTQIFVTMGGSDIVQQFNVNTGARPFTVTKGTTIKTQHRPFGLALNEAKNQLYVTDWGSERLEIFDLTTGNQVQAIDLGYAQPEYPATNIEKGELFFYNAAWSNNGRKSCASCHFDELDTDGVGFSNGATTPTAYHQVKPNHNLATTDSYFWNGSFGDGNYTSVAFAAQTRDNCELVEFGLIEGPGSNAQTRVGDPNNKVTLGAAQDAQCRPVDAGPAALQNQATIDQIKKQELNIRDTQIIPQTTQQVLAETQAGAQGLDTQTLSRLVDFYDVAEVRLPPNPLHQLFKAQQVDSATAADITNGKAIFGSAGCASCHDPNNTRHPFTDGVNHGRQADWIARFINTYQNDARVTAILPQGLPQTFLQANAPSTNDHEINAHLDPNDFFTPFCFDVTNCFEFDDPLLVRGDTTEETRRLNLLVTVNLADPDRQFIPGNVRGAPQVNTPSLRGVWTQANLLHHGLGHTIAEAILGPGHPALKPGEVGWAVDATGALDVHGVTKALKAADVQALVRYVENIE
jgi:mono/diheme cytochrome c family protein